MNALENKWQTKNQLVDLLCELVEIPSVTNTIDEINVAEYVEKSFVSFLIFKRIRSI